MQIESTLQQGRSKADITYYNSFMNLSKERYFSVFLNFLKALQSAILIPCNIYIYNADQTLINCMIFNLSASILGLGFSLFSLFYIFRSVSVFLNTALQTGHTVAEEKTNDLSSVEACLSSNVYVADSNIRTEDVDEPTRKIYDATTKNAINTSLKMRYGWFRNGDHLYSVMNFCSMINSIVVLSTISMNGTNETNLIIYVIVVGLSEFMLIIGCILIALSPLICLGCCIFCCCCKKGDGQGNGFINIPMKDATMTDIVNAGGNCAICYQSINEKDKIYVLLCSDKHVFHCDCLRHWTKVKNNCPICRQDIPMIDHALEGDAEQQAIQESIAPAQ